MTSTEKGLVIASFDAQNGEYDSFLGMDNIYAKSNNGIRYDYGAKYNNVATINITMINFDGSDFTVNQFRDVARWLSGAQKSSWLDLYDGETIAYSFLCKCVNMQQYKIDARTIGVIVTFESVSPWAYSATQSITVTVDNRASAEEGTPIKIENLSDESYSYVYPNITFSSTSNGAFVLYNHLIKEYTIVNNIKAGEIITLNSNQIIYSSNSSRVFGDDFNFVWPKLIYGNNTLSASGQGTLTISYRYPVKIGDCVINVGENINCGMCQDASQEIATDVDVTKMFNNVFYTVF
jgi:hypothetical protein